MSSRPRASLAVVLFLACAAASPRGFAEPRFSARSLPVEIGRGSPDADFGDLNADGYVDLVTVSIPLEVLSVHPGLGNGRFGAPTHYRAGSWARSVATGHVDTNSSLDVVCLTYDTLNVFLGNGDGSLQRAHQYPRIAGRDVMVADLDGDHVDDVVVPSVGVLLARGDGSFGEPVTNETLTTSSVVALGDLDHDGRVDMVAAPFRQGGHIAVLLGQGDGTFGAPTTYETGHEIQAMALGDLNADGTSDVVTFGWDGVVAFLGLGDGTFGTSATTLFESIHPGALMVRDLDGDGRSDLAATVISTNELHPSRTLQVLHGRGDGFFDAPIKFTVGDEPVWVGAADLTDDGRPDLVTVNNVSATVSVLPNRGGLNFGTVHEFAAGGMPSSALPLDANGDSWTDLAVVNHSTLTFLLGGPPGGFGPPVTILSGWPLCWAVAAGDIDSNGSTDLVATVEGYGGAGSAVVLRGDGAGHFEPIGEYATGVGPMEVHLTDLDADGRLDLAVCNSYSETLAVRLGNGDGTFRAPRGYTTPASPRSVVFEDFDGDGSRDVAILGEISSEDLALVVKRGLGDGSFTAIGSYPLSPFSTQVVAADVNEDGHWDLVCSGAGTNRVSIFLGVGDGNFGSRADFAAGRSPLAVAVADFDADGHLDVVLPNATSNTISVLPGRGDGTFGPRVLFGTGAAPVNVALADLNNDAQPDIIVCDSEGGVVETLFNQNWITPVLVEDFSARPTDGGIRLQWSLRGAVAELAGIAVQRSPGEAGPYHDLVSPFLVPGAAMSFEDREAGQSAEYWYRLVCIERNGTRSIAGPITASRAVASATFALRAPAVGLGSAPVTITYSVGAVAAPARLGIFDVRGQRVWTTPLARRDPGWQSIDWDRRDATGGQVARGVYLVRLESAGRVRTSKLVLPVR